MSKLQVAHVGVVEAKLYNALKSLKIPIARIHFEGEKRIFITYQRITAISTNFADDMAGGKEITWGIDLYINGITMSGIDYFDILTAIEEVVTMKGFFGFEIDAETYEPETGYYHTPMTIKYYMEG